MESISCHIIRLVINSLGSGHTHTNIHTYTHIQMSTQKLFLKTKHALATGQHMSGLKINPLIIMAGVIVNQKESDGGE